MQPKYSLRCTHAIAGAFAGLMLAVSGAALAESMGGHPMGENMGHERPMMGGHGCDKEDGHGMDHGMMSRGMQPHNAASHFLQMTQLNLTDDQVKQLTKLRDEYVEKNATAEEQYKAANTDLMRELFADDVDMAMIKPLFEKIGRLDVQLWGAFAQQLHDIKSMLTEEQKKALKSQRSEGHHGGSSMPHDNMPMQHDSK